jgi:DNA-binding response OmpR family regulator
VLLFIQLVTIVLIHHTLLYRFASIGALMYTPIAVCVDNDPNTAHVVQETLRRLGYRVEIAHTQADAVRLAQEFKPALAYVSNEMHGIDAMEVYRDMQQVSKRTRGILMTAVTTGLMVMLTDHTGVNQVMMKPTSV